MLDLVFVRNNPGLLDKALKDRNKIPVEQELLNLDAKFRSLQTKLQKVHEERNTVSNEIGRARVNGGNSSELCTRIEILKKERKKLEDETNDAKISLLNFLYGIPNIPSDECPIGIDESYNVEVRRFSTPRQFDFKPLEHHELGMKLNMMNFERTSKIAGSRFVFLFSDIAKLERALAQFMLDTHIKEGGYTEVYTPLILNAHAMFGVAQLPKFEEDLFKTTTGLYLIPTAEASLSNIHNDELLNGDILPLRYTAYTPCFRSEAGAAGRDTIGMLRQHQFGKVELVSITRPDQAIEEHERMTECAEGILKKLNLPYRTVILSTGDMGFSSEKTYDIEVWLPGQDKYREISSCSRCGTFQARRMNTRFKNKATKSNEFVHTLNGSGVAVGRCLIAIMENYQLRDGSIEIPEVLIPYFGKSKIAATGN